MHYISNIQRYSIHDGDGIRTTVFFKGCNMRCEWCHNPETQLFTPEIEFDESKCVGCGACAAVCPKGAIKIIGGKAVMDRKKCEGCGKCEAACLQGARELVGEEYSVQDIIKTCMKDEIFYDQSGGGVTMSGGEVMTTDMDDYLIPILKKLHRNGISVAIDTCGYVSWERYEKVIPYADFFLYDLKVMDDELHKKYTGVSNKVILENLKGISKAGATIYIRIPVVREVNGNRKNMEDLVDFLKENDIHPKYIDLLPYHSFGAHKYAKLDREYLAKDMTAPSDEEMQELVDIFKKSGFADVRIGG